MNLWQAVQQVIYTLRAATWTGGARVFVPESVVCAGDLPDDFVQRVGLPCALIRVQEAVADPEHDEEPDILTQTFDVTIAAAIPADAFGQASFLGANRSANTGQGLLELEEKLIEAIGGMTDANGVHMLVRAKGAAGGTPHPRLGYIAWRSYRFEASVTASRFYHPATRFAGTAAGGGAAALTWRLPPTRFDTRRMILRRVPGSTAPAGPTLGAAITLGGAIDGAGVSSKTDTPGVGAWSYGLWAVYDEYGSSSDEKYSAAATKTVVVT